MVQLKTKSKPASTSGPVWPLSKKGKKHAARLMIAHFCSIRDIDGFGRFLFMDAACRRVAWLIRFIVRRDLPGNSLSKEQTCASTVDHSERIFLGCSLHYKLHSFAPSMILNGFGCFLVTDAAWGRMAWIIFFFVRQDLSGSSPSKEQVCASTPDHSERIFLRCGP